jgi:predicted hydrocarbon binding protein
MQYKRKVSQFTWKGFRNIDVDRENLEPEMPVLIYRLFQHTLKDILTREYDEEVSGRLYRAAGHLAGKSLAQNVLDVNLDINTFMKNLTDKLKEMKIGILRIEKADLNNFSFTITVSEDLYCSGLPVAGEAVCYYDEGLIAGILEAYKGYEFEVKEIDCWATGGRICRFSAHIK